MSYETLPEGSVVLRLEFSIADAVHQRGLLSVLGTAIMAWWNRPGRPTDLPASLRADVGLPPEAMSSHWLDVTGNRAIPAHLRRPGM